jgi:hypothetical protein
VRPVRIIADVIAGGHLFEAISLVNGVSIVQETTTRHVTWHHIELDEHDPMFAGGPLTVLHPDFARTAPDDSRFCVPLIREGAVLAALRRRLAARARRFIP